MVTEETLNRAVYQYCGEIVNQKKKQQSSLKKYERNNYKMHWDYPAVAVACCFNHQPPIKRDYSRGVRKTHLAPILVNKLEELGEIGEKSRLNTCKYIIGRCAEPHSANNLIKNVCCQLEDIYFSVAMRPRTREIIDYCENCKYTFSNL